jgi:hypothetical protein
MMTFNGSVSELATFHAAHGRKPNSKSSDPEEKRLGGFLVTVRGQARGGQGAHLLTGVRRAYLDRVAAWWSDALDFDDARERVFRGQVDALVVFHATHGCKPIQHSSDPVEARAGWFLNMVRGQARGGQDAHLLTPARRAYLDRVSAWWSDALDVDDSHERQFRANADALDVFHTTHGRKPSQQASDPVEAWLSGFLVTVRVQAGGGQSAHLLTPARRAYLDRVVPWWSAGLGPEALFLASVADLASFHHAHSRRPSECTSDVAERRLGLFLSRMRALARSKSRRQELTPARRAYLDLVVPWWSDGLDVVEARDRRFRATVDSVGSFCQTNGRKPSSTSSNVEERRLGCFLVVVRQQARGGQGAHRLTAGRRVYLDRVVPWWSDVVPNDNGEVGR